MTTRAHGTTGRYRFGPDINDQPGKGCRCPKCRAAQVKAIKAYRLRLVQGIPSRLVDAQPARRHALNLHEQGLPLSTIAALAGICDRTVYDLVSGKPGQGIPPTQRVRRETAAAILAVRPEHVAQDGSVLALGTERRLQALAAAGWPSTHIAQRLDMTPDHVLRLARGECGPTVYASTALRVARVFRELWNVDPVSRGVDPLRAAQVRRMAARNQYAPAMAWNAIDNPSDKPRGVRPGVAS